MGPSCSSPRTASSMVSARRAMRPIVAIYPRVANAGPVGVFHRAGHPGHVLGPCGGSPYPVERLGRRYDGGPGPLPDHRPAEPTTVSGKRRAAGPADTSTRTTPPKKGPAKGKGGPTKQRTRKQKVWRVLRWGLVAALVLVLIGVGGFIYAYQTTEIPDPNKDFETQTSFVYY